MLFLIFVCIADGVGCSSRVDITKPTENLSRYRKPDEPRERKTDGIIIFSDQIEKIKQHHCGG